MMRGSMTEEDERKIVEIARKVTDLFNDLSVGLPIDVGLNGLAVACASTLSSIGDQASDNPFLQQSVARDLRREFRRALKTHFATCETTREKRANKATMEKAKH